MAVAIAGLNKKPTYNELIGEALQDQFYNVNFPNRNAIFYGKGIYYRNWMAKVCEKCRGNKKWQVKKLIKNTCLTNRY